MKHLPLAILTAMLMVMALFFISEVTSFLRLLTAYSITGGVATVYSCLWQILTEDE